MRLKVDVLPAEELVYPDVVLVVDVIRSTTTAVCLLEAGAVGVVDPGLVEEVAFGLL